MKRNHGVMGTRTSHHRANKWSVVLGFALCALASHPAYGFSHLRQIGQAVGSVNGDTTAQAVQLRRSGGRMVAYDSGAALFTKNAGAGVTVTPMSIPKGSQVIDLQPVVTGLIAPVQVTHAGDRRLFVVDQVGQIRIVQDGGVLPTLFLDIASRMVPLNPVYDERGLLGLAFHPNYASNGKFYVYYSAPPATPGFDNRSVISELTVSADPNVADAASERVVLAFDHPQSNHNAGQLAFGPDDGYLYISSGDGGAANDAGPHHTLGIGNAQDRTNLLGKILRIDVDNRDPGLQYAIPATNPFAGSDTDRREIYAYGLRNPLGGVDQKSLTLTIDGM